VDESEPEIPEAEAPAPTPRTKPPMWQDPWFRFAAVFGLLALVSEIIYFAVALESVLFRKYLETLAAMSAWILEQMTTGIKLRGTIIHGDLFSVQIAPGCDAYRICALLGSAILAFPARWKTKAIGLFFGLLWLNSLNFVRIVGLYFIGAYWHEHFQDSHEVYFPIFLICMTIAAWMIWVRSATDDLIERQRNAS
jgi:exosortase H (IPTLxxWG-CTERM-specific)